MSSIISNFAVTTKTGIEENRRMKYIYIVIGQSNACYSPVASLTAPYDVAIPNSYIFFKPNSQGDNDASFSANNGSFQNLQFGVNHTLTDLLATHYGPVLRFAYEMQDYRKRDIYLIHFHKGGTGLAMEGSTPGVSGSGGILDWSPSSSTELYHRLINYYCIPARDKLIAQGYIPVFKAVLWVHGEQDATYSGFANAYEANLLNLASNLRTDLGNPSMHFCISRMTGGTFGSAVRTGQVNVGSLTNNSWIDTDAMARYDTLHITESGQVGYQFYLNVKDL